MVLALKDSAKRARANDIKAIKALGLLHKIKQSDIKHEVREWDNQSNDLWICLLVDGSDTKLLLVFIYVVRNVIIM